MKEATYGTGNSVFDSLMQEPESIAGLGLCFQSLADSYTARQAVCWTQFNYISLLMQDLVLRTYPVKSILYSWEDMSVGVSMKQGLPQIITRGCTTPYVCVARHSTTRSHIHRNTSALSGAKTPSSHIVVGQICCDSLCNVKTYVTSGSRVILALSIPSERSGQNFPKRNKHMGRST